MTMKRAIIHIGPHKTGSSYLQVCFARYRDALRQRGIVVPAAWEQHGNVSHSGLVDAVREGGDLAAAAEVIAREFAAGGETLLVSAEDFSTLSAAELQRLKTLLGDSAITIVYYIRRTSDILFSAWQEDVKQGNLFTFPEYFGLHLRNPEVSVFFNLEMRLRPFIEVFGKESIRIVAYSMLRDNDIDLFTHFAQHLLKWHPVEPPPDPQELNKAGTPAEIELLRALNVIETLRNPSAPKNLRDRLDASRGSLDLEHIYVVMEAHQKFMVLSDAFPMISRFHKEQRQRFADNVVPPCPNEFFFRLVRKEIPFIAGDYLLHPGVLDALHTLHGQLAS